MEEVVECGLAEALSEGFEIDAAGGAEAAHDGFVEESGV